LEPPNRQQVINKNVILIRTWAYIHREVPLEKIQQEFQLPKYKSWRNYNDRFKTHIMVMYNELTERTKKLYDIK
jgi:hypothetical protein